MVTFRPGSHVSKLVALLSFVGEYPFWSLDLLGSERVYKALIVKLTQPEHFVNSQTGAEMDFGLCSLSAMCPQNLWNRLSTKVAIFWDAGFLAS